MSDKNLSQMTNATVNAAKRVSALCTKKLRQLQEEEQHRIQQEAQAQLRAQQLQNIANLRVLLANALEVIPSNHQFYGSISHHALNLSLDDAGFVLELPVVDENKLPVRLRTFTDELERVLNSRHCDALAELETQLRIDAEQRLIREVELSNSGSSWVKSDSEMWADYTKLFRSLVTDLCKVTNVVAVRAGNVVKVYFNATPDCGIFAPANYPNCVRMFS